MDRGKIGSILLVIGAFLGLFGFSYIQGDEAQIGAIVIGAGAVLLIGGGVLVRQGIGEMEQRGNY